MDKLTSMEVFVRVAEKGSFTQVALEFNLSPTMIAKHIRFLETDTQTKLINRTTRKQHLTALGQLYYEKCKEILAQVKATDQLFKDQYIEPQGILRVTAPVTAGIYHIVPLISQFMEKYPKIKIDLHLNDRVIDLVDEGFEIGLRSGKNIDDHLVATQVKPYKMILTASPEYLKQYGIPNHPTDLEQHNCLSFSIWGANHHWKLSKGHEYFEIPIESKFTVNNGQALKSAALNHMGILLQSEILVKKEIEQNQLVQILSDWQLPSRPLYIVRPFNQRPSLKVRTFIDFLIEKIGKT